MKITSIITTAVLSLGLTGIAQAASFNLGSGNGTQNLTNINNFGNSYAFGPSGGVSVTVTAFSSTNGTSFTAALVGQYSGGLGVSNTTEGLNASEPNHAMDNVGGVDYLKFVFSQSVTLTSVSFGYVTTDNDFRYWVGTNLAAPGAGGTDVNGQGTGANPYTLTGTGNTLWIAAQPDTATWGNSYFKVSGLAFTTTGNSTSTPDAGSTVALLGLAIAGLAFAKRRFAA